MSKNKDLKDMAILQALSGSESPEHHGMQIETDYFLREKMENMREQGLNVPEEHLPIIRSQNEKDIWKRQHWLAELEQTRTNRPEEAYDGQEEDIMATQEKKEMKFADSRLFEKWFETQLNIKQVKSKTSGKWFTIITIGKDKDKVFLVSARKDGLGTSLSTDWKDYMVKDVATKAIKI